MSGFAHSVDHEGVTLAIVLARGHHQDLVLLELGGSAAASPIPLTQSIAVNNMADKKYARLNPSPLQITFT